MKISTMAAWRGQSVLFCSDAIIQHGKDEKRNNKKKAQKCFVLAFFGFGLGWVELVCLLLYSMVYSSFAVPDGVLETKTTCQKGFQHKA